MRLKSFHARTMAEAMQQVRQVLGDDAIIVATREEEGVGVRVTAAVEEDGLAAAPAPPARVPETIGPPVLDAVEAVLVRHAVPEDLRNQMLDSIADLDARDPLTALSASLDAGFGFHPLPDGRFDRPMMLVGPPGAGKTLTVAKLCARAAIRGVPIGVISTDTVRAGAIEQLQAFTRVLKQRLITVEDAAALADALEVQRGAQQVLVDSAGRNPYHSADMGELRDQLAAAAIEPVLVLPAGLDADEAVEIAQAFREVGVRRMLPTRLDLARRLGSLLAAANAADLALADAGTTAKVADGLVPLSPTQLARLLMPEAVTRSDRSSPQKSAVETRRPKQTGTHP